MFKDERNESKKNKDKNMKQIVDSFTIPSSYHHHHHHHRRQEKNSFSRPTILSESSIIHRYKTHTSKIIRDITAAFILAICDGLLIEMSHFDTAAALYTYLNMCRLSITSTLIPFTHVLMTDFSH